MAAIESHNALSDCSLLNVRWKDLREQAVYVCRACFFEDKEAGGYTVQAKNLPGVVSEGDDLESAVRNVKDAFLNVARSYLDANEDIPWGAVPFDATPDLVKHLQVSLDG